MDPIAPPAAGRELSAEECRLIELNLGLAIHIAGRHRPGRRPHFDDRLDAALEGLVAAAIGFDPARGKDFASYAGVAIRRAIDLEILNGGPVRIPVRHNRAAAARPLAFAAEAARARSVGGLPEEGIAVRHPDPAERLIAEEERAAVAGALASLPAEERRVLEARAAGLTGVDLARELGCSREWVRQLGDRALARAREALAGPARPAARTAIEQDPRI